MSRNNRRYEDAVLGFGAVVGTVLVFGAISLLHSFDLAIFPPHRDPRYYEQSTPGFPDVDGWFYVRAGEGQFPWRRANKHQAESPEEGE